MGEYNIQYTSIKWIIIETFCACTLNFKCQLRFPLNISKCMLKSSNCNIHILYSGSCKSYQFRCPDGLCIGKGLLCDGWPDCIDSSDEHSCCKLSIL